MHPIVAVPLTDGRPPSTEPPISWLLPLVLAVSTVPAVDSSRESRERTVDPPESPTAVRLLLMDTSTRLSKPADPEIAIPAEPLPPLLSVI